MRNYAETFQCNGSYNALQEVLTKNHDVENIDGIGGINAIQFKC